MQIARICEIFISHSNTYLLYTYNALQFSVAIHHINESLLKCDIKTYRSHIALYRSHIGDEVPEFAWCGAGCAMIITIYICFWLLFGAAASDEG